MASALPDQVRAAVFVGPGLPLEIREFPRPKLTPGEALVRVTCCTLCGSDLHTYEGRRPAAIPIVLGHEIVGQIAEIGPGETVRDVAGRALGIGDRVSWSVAAHCGECYYCGHGLPQKCDRLFKYGHQSCGNGRALSGGLAEFCHLAVGTSILRIPDEIPDMVAASANCATATVVAAFRAAGNCRDRSVLIQGAGLLGLTAAAMAHTLGAKQITVADIDGERLKWATRFGATDTLDVSQSPAAVRSQVLERNEGRGVDVALEMSGTPAAVEQGLGLLRVGGQFILVGSVFPSRPVALHTDQFVRRMLTLQGIHNYAPQDLSTAVDFLARHHAAFPFRELVAEKFPLDLADAAFQRSIDSRAVRIAVCPQLPTRQSVPPPHRPHAYSLPVSAAISEDISEQ